MGSPLVLPLPQLGAAAALLFFMATIFRGRAAPRARRLAQMASDRQQTNSSSSSSHLSRSDVSVPDIFLSHSGRQKPFVEQLYNALVCANHTPFFDQHSLPKASCFPSQIKRAASDCKIGVVVLSEDFFTSKWPMLELELLVKKPEACVLPLFYKLRPQDLKSPKNLSRWRRVWKKKVGKLAAEQWEQVVKTLDSFNGEIFAEKTSEAAYIKKVVHHICNLLPSHASYDLSSIQGQSRLSQEIARKFEHLDAKRACMVGLHGVGGLGKTTLCKIMVNHYNSQYLGRSLLIEFPSERGNSKQSKIVEECKKALSELANLDEHVLKRVHSFDQVVQLIKDHVCRYDVFVAIDNVWESSMEEAERLLGVGFSAKTKILVTSRSEEVLKGLLGTRGHVNNNANVAPLPAPEREEAFQIFQKSFTLGDLNSLVVDRNQMDQVLERCRFSGKYHALALKALAQYAKSVCMYGDLEEIKHHLSGILEEISNADLPNLEDVIRLSFENLPEHKKHMFLDIAVLSSEERSHNGPLRYGKAHEWMSALYMQFSKRKITRLMHELALDGLIQIEEERYGEKVIQMHDLYLDFAWREAGSSSRFLTKSSAKSVGDSEWEMLERVMILEGDDMGPCFWEKVQQQKCRKLQFLYADDMRVGSGIRLDFMASLRLLFLSRVEIGADIKNWSATGGVDNDQNGGATRGSCAGNEIVDVELCYDVLKPLQHAAGKPSLDNAPSFLDLNGAVQLQVLEVEECRFGEGIVGLGALRNLQKLTVLRCQSLENLDGLSGLIRLQALRVVGCKSLQKMPDVSGLPCLEMLAVGENDALEEVGGLSSTLKVVEVYSNHRLKRMPDVSGLTNLERLALQKNEGMEEVEGEYLPCTLRYLDIVSCRSLRRLPSWEKCMHTMKELSTSAHHLRMQGISLHNLTNLHTLHLEGGDQETVEQWKRLPWLQSLSISHLIGVQKIDVGCHLTGLRDLVVHHCEALEEIGDLSALHSLESLAIFRCGRLTRLDSMSSIPLKRLFLSDCDSLQTTSIPSTILLAQHIYIRDCGALKK